MLKLSAILNLKLAWQRVKADQYNDLLPDILELRDVDSDIDATIQSIKTRLDSGYQPSDALRIDVPKKGYTLRPGSSLVPEDRLVYQALADFISKWVEEPPREACFSYRINKTNSKSKSMFQFWRKSWLQMKEKMRDLYESGQYCCLLRTDIAAYFEHVDHDILKTDILDPEIKRKDALEILDRLLRKWAVSEARHLGLPQGCDASSYFGNLYLREVDKIMIRNGFRYFRYSDEIFVFTKDKREARKAIKALTHELRRLHLNLQDAKTEIIEDPEKIQKEIGTEEDDKIRDFDYEFNRKAKKGEIDDAKEEIIKRYKEVTRNGRAKQIDLSKFRWCINKLTSIRCDKALHFLLSRLTELPFLADLYFKYVSLFIDRRKVKEQITTFLSSDDNLYDWQEMWLLLTLSKAKKASGLDLTIIRDIARSSEKHWASRVAAILVLGKLGDNTDRIWLKTSYPDEDNINVKRAIAISSHNLQKAVRNRFYSKIERDSESMTRLVKYLRQDNIETI